MLAAFKLKTTEKSIQSFNYKQPASYAQYTEVSSNDIGTDASSALLDLAKLFS